MTTARRTQPSNTPATSGPDYRIRREDVTHEWRDSFSRFEDGRTAAGTEVGYIPRDVEVQAFRPATSGGGVSQDIVIALGLHGPDGEAMVMLSKDEAREVALMLLAGYEDAGRLEVERYLEAHRAEVTA